MPDAVGSLVRHAARVICLFFISVLPVRAQPPLVKPPTAADFMSRFDFRLWAAALSNPDDRFSWDTHWGGDFDLVDYVHGRTTFLADYEALVGNQNQPFDPYQSVYTLEAMTSVRARKVEVFVVLNHVSWHLGDRLKTFGIAENSLGPRVVHRFGERGTSVDLRAEWRKVIEHAHVDYSWIGAAELTARRPLSPRTTLYGRGFAKTFLVDKRIAGRSRQDGGRVEAGVRVGGGGGAMEFFGGYERMVDADPIARIRRRWAFAGFRLLGKE